MRALEHCEEISTTTEIPLSENTNNQFMNRTTSTKSRSVDVVLANVRISSTSSVLGFFGFVLTYLFAPEHPSIVIPVFLIAGVCAWIIWEVYWWRKWYGEEKFAGDLMESFGDCLYAGNLLQDHDSFSQSSQESVLRTSYLKQVGEILRGIQLLAAEISINTAQTPLR